LVVLACLALIPRRRAKLPPKAVGEASKNRASYDAIPAGKLQTASRTKKMIKTPSPVAPAALYHQEVAGSVVLPPRFSCVGRPLSIEHPRPTSIRHLIPYQSLGQGIDDDIPPSCSNAQKEIEVFVTKEEIRVWEAPKVGEYLPSDKGRSPGSYVNASKVRRPLAGDMRQRATGIASEGPTVCDDRADASMVRPAGKISDDAIGSPYGEIKQARVILEHIDPRSGSGGDRVLKTRSESKRGTHVVVEPQHIESRLQLPVDDAAFSIDYKDYVFRRDTFRSDEVPDRLFGNPWPTKCQNDGRERSAEAPIRARCSRLTHSQACAKRAPTYRQSVRREPRPMLFHGDSLSTPLSRQRSGG
jgi:hypothetical protein